MSITMDQVNRRLEITEAARELCLKIDPELEKVRAFVKIHPALMDAEAVSYLNVVIQEHEELARKTKSLKEILAKIQSGG